MRSLRRRFVHTPLLAAAVLSLAACGASVERTDRRTHGADALTAAARVAPGTLADLFADAADYAESDFAAQGPACRFPFDGGAKAVAWPAATRAFLAQVLGDLEDGLAGVALRDRLRGIYLIDQPPGASAGLQGITCLDAAGRAAVFLNATYAVAHRTLAFGAGNEARWQPETVVALDGAEVQAHPDQLVATLAHEVFHALDFTMLLQFDGRTVRFREAGRKAVYDLSWNAAGGSRFRPVSVAALTGPTPADVAAEYEYLAEETNLVAPYAATSAVEDFAVTLETYFLATRFYAYQRREVFDGKDGASLYVFDQGALLATDGPQRQKVCAAAALLFASKCAEALP